MDSMIASAGIGALGNVFGAALSGGDDGPSEAEIFRSQRRQLSLQHRYNLKDARERAKHMVSGAKRAGVHPSVLFGAGGLQSPSWSIGGVPLPSDGGDNTGQYIASMGQDISRAIMAGMSNEERKAEAQRIQERQTILDNLNLERHALDVQHMGLQNSLLASQLKRLETQATPPVPNTGTKLGGPPGHKIVPAEITASRPGQSSLTAGPAAPAQTEYVIGGPNWNYKIDLPAGSSASEALESLGPLAPIIQLSHWGLNKLESNYRKPAKQAWELFRSVPRRSRSAQGRFSRYERR